MRIHTHTVHLFLSAPPPTVPPSNYRKSLCVFGLGKRGLAGMDEVITLSFRIHTHSLISQAASGQERIGGLSLRFPSECRAAFISLAWLRPNSFSPLPRPLLLFRASILWFHSPSVIALVPSTLPYAFCGQAWVRTSITHSDFLLLLLRYDLYIEFLLMSAAFLTV